MILAHSGGSRVVGIMPLPTPFAANRSKPDREELILSHLPQVQLIARKIFQGLPDHVSLDDLISAGTIGLISAIDRYDPSIGVQLRTYAEYKIRGAILDNLRKMDWAPRRQRRRARHLRQAIAAVEQAFLILVLTAA